MCDMCKHRESKDAKFWRILRRALLMVAAGIAERYPEGSGKEGKAA